MKTDEGFRDRVLAAADVEARLEAAAAEGFDVTADELGEWARRLGDGELDIAGGDNPCVGYRNPCMTDCDCVAAACRFYF
jgi:predicted ribosomally synthesized peptide with nif11-like leader